MTLARETCVACRRDSPRVTDQEIAELSRQITEWELSVTDDVPKLERSFKFRNFEQAIAFAVTVGAAAEGEGHHPRLTVEWGRVGVEWWTHKIKGLHRNDFVMAAKTDQLYAQSQ